MFLLERSEIPRLHVKLLPPNARFSDHDTGNYSNKFKCIHPKHQKDFSKILLYF